MGMESFDLAKFDYTSPASWEALGDLWQVTNGYLPSTEQLMQFVMASASRLSEMTPAPEFRKNATASIPNAVTAGGKAWGGFLGAAGYGNSGNMHIEGGMGYYDNGQATDAVVLGESSDGGQTVEPNLNSTLFGVQNESALVSSSGRMQKVGDKWVFVRGTAVGFS
jgi:protein NRD1